MVLLTWRLNIHRLGNHDPFNLLLKSPAFSWLYRNRRKSVFWKGVRMRGYIIFKIIGQRVAFNGTGFTNCSVSQLAISPDQRYIVVGVSVYLEIRRGVYFFMQAKLKQVVIKKQHAKTKGARVKSKPEASKWNTTAQKHVKKNNTLLK